MTKTDEMNNKGRQLFEDMQDAICEHSLDSNQTVCALSELLVWALLVSHGGDERAAMVRFDGLISPIRIGIRANASHIRDVTTQLDRMP